MKKRGKFFKPLIYAIILTLLLPVIPMVSNAEDASEEPTVTIKRGAQIRDGLDGNQGMRFMISITQFSKVIANGGDVGFELQVANGAKVVVSFNGGNENYRKLYYYDEENDIAEYTAVIRGIPAAHYNTKISATGFFKKTMTENKITTDTINRSIQQAATNMGATINEDGSITLEQDSNLILHTKFNMNHGTAFQIELLNGKTFNDAKYLKADMCVTSPTSLTGSYSIRVYAHNVYGKMDKINGTGTLVNTDIIPDNFSVNKWFSQKIDVTNETLNSFSGTTADFSIYIHANGEFDVKNIRLLDENENVIGKPTLIEDGDGVTYKYYNYSNNSSATSYVYKEIPGVYQLDLSKYTLFWGTGKATYDETGLRSTDGNCDGFRFDLPKILKPGERIKITAIGEGFEAGVRIYLMNATDGDRQVETLTPKYSSPIVSVLTARADDVTRIVLRASGSGVKLSQNIVFKSIKIEYLDE